MYTLVNREEDLTGTSHPPPPPTHTHTDTDTDTIYILSRNMKISVFYLKKFHFLEVKFSLYLNRHVF